MNRNGTLKARHTRSKTRRMAVCGLAAICALTATMPAMAQRTVDVPTFVVVAVEDQSLQDCAQALGMVFAPPEPPVRISPEWPRGAGPSTPLSPVGEAVQADETCLTISGGIGVANFDLGGGIGLGTLPGPAPEPFLIPHGGRLWGGKANIGVEFITPGASFDWAGFYSRVGGSAFASEPIGGAPVAYTFGQDSFGSTGLFLGATGADASSEIAHSGYGMEMDILALRHMYGADVDIGDRPLARVSFGAATLLSHSVTEHSGTFQSLTFPDISSDVDRRLSSTAIGIGPKIGLDIDMGPFTLTSDVSVKAIWRQSDFQSHEAITCGPCGGGLPATFDIDIADSFSGLDWQAGLDLGVEAALNPGLTLILGGSLDWGGRDTIRVRANPAEPITGIERIMAADWSVSAGIKGRF